MTEPTTDYGQLIERIVTMDDPEQRRQAAKQLARRLEHAFGQSVDNAQVIRWETEEWLRQRVGEMNDLVSQLNANQQATKGEIAGGFDGLAAALAAFRSTQEAAAVDLRREFHSGLNAVGENVSQLRGDVKQMRADMSDISNDVGVLRQEMGRQNTRLSHLEAGQAALHGQQSLQAGQIQELTRQIEEMRQEANRRPSLEETATLIERINTTYERLNRLEQAGERSQ